MRAIEGQIQQVLNEIPPKNPPRRRRLKPEPGDIVYGGGSRFRVGPRGGLTPIKEGDKQALALLEYTSRDLIQGIDWDFINMQKHYEEARRRGVRYVPYNTGSPRRGSNGQYIFFKSPLSPKSKKRGYTQDAWYQTIRLMDFKDAMGQTDLALRDRVNLAVSGDLQVHCTCFTGDTVVPLLDGRKRTMEQLHEEYGTDKKFWVYSSDMSGDFVPKQAVCLGVTRKVKSLVRITLDNGESFTCTPDHKLRLRNGSYLDAESCVPGTSLMPLYRKVNSSGYLEVRKNSSRFGWERVHDKVARIIMTEDLVETILRAEADGSKRPNVHHENENKRDNCPKNLTWFTVKEHWELHDCPRRGAITHNFADKWQDPVEREVLRQKLAHAGRVSQEKHPECRENIEHAIQWVRKNSDVLADRMRNKWSNNCDQMLAAVREVSKRPEVRKAQSEGQKRAWGDPEKREKRVATMRSQRSTKQYKSMQRESQKKAWNGLEKRKQHSECMKQVWARRKAEALATKNHKVVSTIRIELDTPVPVYCLSVEDTHNFALEAGIYVSNCPAFNWWGYRYIVAQLDTGLYPQEIRPDVRNPSRRGVVCKHLATVLRVLPFWMSDINRDLRLQGYGEEEQERET